MNPSYFRIRLNKEKAIERLCGWNGKNIKEKTETQFDDAVSVSIDENGQWKGSCLYVYENKGWTVLKTFPADMQLLELKTRRFLPKMIRW